MAQTMSAIVDVFKIKPFALEPIYDSWPSAPIFQGNPSRDQPVDDWLAQIKEGCLARRVPKEYWHKVAQHYLGPHARARFDELKAVMRTLHGGRYMWNWKRFKCAMRNMGWEIDVHKTEEIKVQRKPSGVWWIVGGRRERAEPDSDTVSVSSTSSSVNKDLPAVPSDASATRPVPKKAMTWDFASFKGFPTPKRSNTMTTVETLSSISTTPPPPYTPPPEKTSAQSMLLNAAGKPADPPTGPTEVAHAPTWLLNASQALGFLATEHPKAMTAISAVLITIGSIPALPAIATGAGGAFLASGTAQAIGSIAIGVGSLISAVNNPKAAQAQKA